MVCRGHLLEDFALFDFYLTKSEASEFDSFEAGDRSPDPATMNNAGALQ
jgi:hypothetical protein